LAAALAGCGEESTQPPNPPLDLQEFRKLAVVLDRGEVGSWDAAGVAFPSVLYDRRLLKFRMWYSGFDSSRWRIGYAVSNDGVTWFRHPEPVLPLGDSGAWDSESVLAPCVVADGDTLRMWYTGEAAGSRQIGYAYSLDGVNWVKHRGNPVFSQGTGAEEPAVVKWASDRWLMLFATLGTPRAIGAARSDDGIGWAPLRQAPVLAPSSGWDRKGVAAPALLSDAGGLVLFYAGLGESGSWQIGEASSTDGISWTRMGDIPVLTVGAPVEWDGGSVTSASVLFSPDDASLLLFYSGIDSGWWRIGLARRRL
jgi:predicted GH43/DUF377 family glycosyl hydrolase